MKITKIETILLEKKLSSSMRISRGGFTKRQHLIVRVHTNEGVIGLGEGVGNATLIKTILEDALSPLVIGLDPLNIESLRHKVMDSHVYLEQKGSLICAFSAIEMACWDIKGKFLHVPVHQLLGGLCRETIQAYASDVYWEEDPQKMAKSADRIQKLGFDAVKAHVGCRSPEDDFHRVKALREVLGTGQRLMIDINGGYNLLEAKRALKLWEVCDLFWVEEPISSYHGASLASLRNQSCIPIAAGENEFRTYGFQGLFERGAVDVAMPDIGRVGGIQEAKNICVLADVYGIPVSPHNYSSGILLAATIHLMASTPSTTYLEFDTSENAIYQELLLEPLVIEKGRVKVPMHPGLGVHLPDQVLEKFGS